MILCVTFFLFLHQLFLIYIPIISHNSTLFDSIHPYSRSYRISIYDDHIWFPHMMITYHVHIWIMFTYELPYMMFTCIWCSHMMFTYDVHIWCSHVIYRMWCSHVIYRMWFTVCDVHMWFALKSHTNTQITYEITCEHMWLPYVMFTYDLPYVIFRMWCSHMI